jgi:hypothetical protein
LIFFKKYGDLHRKWHLSILKKWHLSLFCRPFYDKCHYFENVFQLDFEKCHNFHFFQNSGTIDKKGRQNIDKCHNLKLSISATIFVKIVALFEIKLGPHMLHPQNVALIDNDKCHFLLNTPIFFENFQIMALIVIMPRPNSGAYRAYSIP